MIYSVYVETFCQPTESLEKVKKAFEFITERKPKEERIESIFGPEIIKLSIETKRKKEIETIAKKIKKVKDIESRISEKGNFYVRFDKAAAFNKKLKFTDEGYAIKLKFNFVSYPKDMKKIKKEIMETFS